MTNIEIDKALALAIGWTENDISVDIPSGVCWIYMGHGECKIFSHKDWNVIGPIGTRYNCFPSQHGAGWWVYPSRAGVGYTHAKSAQRAIAVAVIKYLTRLK